MSARNSLHSNILFYLARMVVNVIGSFIVFAYIAKVLYPEALGRVYFSLEFINWILVIASVGISGYGVREIARHRDDPRKCETIYRELLAISIACSVVGMLFVYGFLCVMKDSMGGKVPLIVIGSINILCNALGVEWYYQGLEQYRYISIRSIVIRLLTIVGVFAFVRSKGDEIAFLVINTINYSLPFIINFIRKMGKPVQAEAEPEAIRPLRHFKPLLPFAGIEICGSLITNFDLVLLGLIASDRSVGLYAMSIKLVRLVLSLLAALASVLFPRSTRYLSEGRTDKFESMIKSSITFVFAVGTFCAMVFCLDASRVLLVVGNESYLEGSTSLVILSALVVLGGMRQLVSYQYFIPKGREKLVLLSLFCAGLASCALIPFLAPRMGQNGAALAVVAAEVIAFAVLLVGGKGEFRRIIFAFGQLKVVACTILLSLAFILLKRVLPDTMPFQFLEYAILGIAFAGMLIAIMPELFQGRMRSSKGAVE